MDQTLLSLMAKKVTIQPKGVWNPTKHTEIDSTGLPWSHAVKSEGTMLFISGQTGVNGQEHIVAKGDIAAQTRQAIKNLEMMVKAAGGEGLSNIVRTRWFVTSAAEFYEKGASAIRREMFKRDFPTSTLTEIKRLANPDAMIEVEAIAVI